MAPVITFVAVDGGACGSLLPVEAYLRRAGHSTRWITEEGSVTAEILQKRGVEVSLYKPGGADFSQVAAVVAGVTGSKGAGADFFVAKEAEQTRIPVVKVIDSWGCGQPHEKGFAPDRLCVLDQPSVEYEARMRRMPEAHIRVTGDPKMDDLLNIDRSTDARRRARQKLGIGDGILIVFCGPSSHELVMEIFPALVNAVRGGRVKWHANRGASEVQPVVIGTLWHPKHAKRSNDIDECYRMLKAASIPFRSDVQLRAALSNAESFVAADLVVGSTSTETVVSCYLGRPTLSAVYPGGKNFNEILAAREMTTLPTVECGAALLAETSEQVSDVINSVFGARAPYRDKLNEMELAQTRHCRLDGKNTERVCEAIREVL